MGEPLRSVTEPEDLLQEVYTEAYLRFETFEDHGPGSFARWMVGIAANVIRQAYKHHFKAKRRDARRRVPLEDEDGAATDRLATPEATPSRIIARNESVRQLAAALDSLDEEGREVVLLRVFEGCSLEEIATRLDKPRTTVAYRLARAITKLEGQVPDLNTVW
jgi:RNA polymerase sigma-70 factor (ECF subfamily)